MPPQPPAGNPFNDRPTVRLLDLDGEPLAVLSHRQAARLLRPGYATLLLELPPAVQLTISTADYQAFSADPSLEENARLRFLHARQGALYGNVHFQSPTGETMFHGDAQKALWYLNRELVEVVSSDPPILRFRFTPAGNGHVGDDYYLTGKVNRCVVCGASEGLNRHHVVPRVYRRHMPPEVKNHSHHDVLLLCLACHEKYEAAADELKAGLGAEHGVPLHGLRDESDRARLRALKYASTLVQQGPKIPEARREEMLRVVGDWTGRWPLSEADLRELAQLDARPGEVRVVHGEHVLASTADVQAFIRRWRQHFLRTMQPRFLPEHWDVERPASPPTGAASRSDLDREILFEETSMNPMDGLKVAMEAVDAYYKKQGIFQGKFGFGQQPALLIIDMAYGWTDPAYAGGSARLDGALAAIAQLLPIARERGVPIVYTTSAWSEKPQFKSAGDFSPGFRPWDRRACEIDERVRPQSNEYLIAKEHASAFAGTALIGHLVERRVDTLLITGCSTSACVRASATDAKSLGLKPIIVREAVQDRSEIAHEWTLFDIQARFADVVGLEEAVGYLRGLGR